MMNLFEAPIVKKEIRKNVYAYKYKNGCININGEKFFFYSMNQAIKEWRQKNKVK